MLASLLQPPLSATAQPVPAQVSACFTPAEHCLPQIAVAVDGAWERIRIQAYGFSSRPVIAALVRAKRRGVDVQVVLDRSSADSASASAMRHAGVPRDKFTSHVPDLMHTDQEMGGQYAPIVLTTNRDVSTIPPDLTKRMVPCHIDAAIPENCSVTERVARRAQKDIGTALYRACLQRPIPEVRAMRAEIDAEIETFSDLLARSADLLRALLGEALGKLPDWARPLGFADYFGIRHRRFRDHLADMLAGAEERITLNRRLGELTISFVGDTNQAAQFARSVPDFVLKGRFADLVKLDLSVLEQEMGFAVSQYAA